MKYDGGWREVVHPSAVTIGRREELLTLGGVSDPERVDAIAMSLLNVTHRTRTTVAAGVHPTGTDRPYVDYLVGDSVLIGAVRQRVTSITVSEDEDGQVQYVPELVDPLTLEEERIQRVIKRMADGTAGGRSESARPAVLPVAPTAGGGPAEAVVFSYPGLLVEGARSSPYSPPYPLLLTHAVLSLGIAGLADSTIDVLVNGTTIVSATIPAGSTHTVVPITLADYYVRPGDVVMVSTAVAGASAEGISVQLRCSTAGTR
ncbi:MAG TPA: hypothetical protein VL179_10725 [Mycobacterium sp.]|nr:hypothetical protein [Mycobacterium sp.]